MFATLLGTNRGTEDHRTLCASLSQLAVGKGFAPPDTTLRIRADQTPLDGWKLEQRGPADTNADFLLAVTAPKVPGISPMPVKKTVTGPLFSVVVMPDFFGVWRDDRRDYSEFKETAQVMEAFVGFLGSLEPKTTDMAPDEFSLYIDSLFLGRIACSGCGLEFSLGARPVQDDATWAASVAREAIEGGWRLKTGEGSKPICPRCAKGSSDYFAR
ncbi:MAG: hypothetical protein HYX64_11355 [Gammaproteobacteria bacterium]|nr:hypothetical protein [Gammaproteobacteria bacterium]